MKPLRVIIALAVIAVLLASAAAAPAVGKINVLIVTGQNNHDWRSTTPVLQDILERSGQFRVTVNEHPEACTAADFAPYDVILSNYNGDRWGPVAEQAFLDFIRAGKGFVVIHAANNAFTDWPEYIALIGGYWGATAGHGRQHQFPVRIVDHSHPITRGMSDFLSSTDELYHRLTMMPDIHLLATAFSAEDTGGTGSDEPMVWTVEWQGGRCFHNALGHHAEAMQGEEFAALVQRGTEWAATGTVSAETDVRTLAPQLGAEDEDARYAAKSRLIGMGEPAVAPLMAMVAAGDAQLAGEARDTLIWIAQRWAGTPQAAGIQRWVIHLAGRERAASVRRIAAHMLGLMGDARAVATLKSMLSEDALREDARQALMQIPGPEATQALVEMLGTVGPESQQAILHALGARGDRAATPAAIDAAQSGNLVVRLAAIDALGLIGDPAGAEPLWDIAATGPAELRSPALDAYLRLAYAALEQGRVHRGVTMYRRALALGQSDVQQVAALVGLGVSGRPEMVNDIRPFLGADNPQVRTTAAAALAQIPGAEATAALIGALKALARDERATVIGFLGQRGDSSATPALIAALSDPIPGVRTAAAEALGQLADATAAGPLRAVIERATDPLRAAALDAYVSVADALLGAGETTTAAEAYLYALGAAQAEGAKARALRGAGATGNMAALPTVKAALDADGDVAAAALEAYVQLGDAAARAGDEAQATAIYTDAAGRTTGPQGLSAAQKLQELGVEVDVAAMQGFITNWWIIGPFPNVNREAWGKQYFPEREVVLDKEYELDGQKLAWSAYHAEDIQAIVPLDEILSPTDNKAAYMYAEVTSPQAMKVTFKVGSDDGIKVWLNGEQVFGNNAARGVVVDQDVFEATLKQGTNDILVEVLNGGSDWDAVVRLVDEQNRPLQLEQRRP
ncbi:MAG: ThuA domain-containing protein [Armatimonadota bacterium]|nr:MAG: ThuA domain-containing protein [Armatimonadota bacterium]